jgi:hypothetical protein
LKLCIKDPRRIKMLAMWPLAGVRAGGHSFDRRFRRGWSPAAGEEEGISTRESGATFGWLRMGSRRSV